MKKLSLSCIAIILYSLSYCQVSYEGHPYQPNEYVQPFDLKLLKEVNTQKQNEYNKNLAVMQERFKSSAKLLNYTSELNKQLIIDEYNKIVQVANQYDLSDQRVINYLNQKLDRLDYILDFVMKYPNNKVSPNVF